MSMLSSAESVMLCAMPFCWNAGFAGEEKEGMGSMPFSSLTPVSLSSTPVRLDIECEYCTRRLLGSTWHCPPSLAANRCVVSRSPLFSRRSPWCHGLMMLICCALSNTDSVQIEAPPQANTCYTARISIWKSWVGEGMRVEFVMPTRKV